MYFERIFNIHDIISHRSRIYPYYLLILLFFSLSLPSVFPRYQTINITLNSSASINNSKYFKILKQDHIELLLETQITVKLIKKIKRQAPKIQNHPTKALESKTAPVDSRSQTFAIAESKYIHQNNAAFRPYTREGSRQNYCNLRVHPFELVSQITDRRAPFETFQPG